MVLHLHSGSSGIRTAAPFKVVRENSNKKLANTWFQLRITEELGVGDNSIAIIPIPAPYTAIKINRISSSPNGIKHIYFFNPITANVEPTINRFPKIIFSRFAWCS